MALLWKEFPGLLREIDQDRARFHHCDWLVVGPLGVDDRGDLVVWVDLQVFGCELFGVGVDVDLVYVVWQCVFLEYDGNLVAVGCGLGVEFDYGEVARDVVCGVGDSSGCHAVLCLVCAGAFAW